MAKCNAEIFDKGKAIVAVSGSSINLEKWVKLLRIESKVEKIDWYYCGGTGVFLYIGNDEERIRIEAAIYHCENRLEGRIVDRYIEDNNLVEPYRAGVTISSNESNNIIGGDINTIIVSE